MPIFSARSALAAAGAATLAVVASGCAPRLTVAPAAEAASVACAGVMVRLPDRLDDRGVRSTTSQATAAWGDPAAVVLRCGLPPVDPTTDTCTTIDGVDWVLQQRTPTQYAFTSFGRDPAVQVLVDAESVDGQEALAALAGAVDTLPRNGRECLATGT